MRTIGAVRLALVALLAVCACTGQIATSPQRDAAAGDAAHRDAATDTSHGADAPVVDGPGGGDSAPTDAPPSQDAAPVDGPQSDAFVVVCPGSTAPECSPGSGTGADCFDAASCYLSKVQAAVNGCINDNPGWFDRSGSCAIITCDINLFMDDVVARIVAQGLCAIRDPNAPGEEVTVKHDNAFSENFDIVASTGCARTGSAIFTSTCAPAWW